MKVSILDKPSEILLQTVTITDNKKSPDNLVLFHCYHCGTGIQRIKGEVVRINAGITSPQTVMTIQQCHRCKENYTFQVVHAKLPNVIKVTLTPQTEREVSTFHCVICRTPVIQYNLDLIVKLPQMTPIHPPSLFACTQCGKIYLLNEIVSLVV